MSKILKRPMFRIGGSTNEGIMSNVVPKRARYQDPTDAVSIEDNYTISESDPIYRDAMRRAAILSKFAGTGRPQGDRLADFLIQGGLNLVGGVGAGGGTLQGIAKSFKEPTTQFLKGGQEEENFQRQLKLAGVTGAMSAADAAIAARAKGKEQFASQLRPERLKTLLGTLEKEAGASTKQNIAIANRILDFQDYAPANMQRKFRFIAPITTTKTKNQTVTGVDPAFIASLDIGDTFLDPSTNDFKVKTAEGIKRLDPETFKPIGK
jgi:hypothetical protein